MGLENLADWGEDFLKSHADKTAFAKLFSWWDDLVGQQIAVVSNPVYYNNEEATLLVEVSDHHWLGELRYHLPNIINKYRQKIHQAGIADKISGIKEIKLKYNPRLIKPESRTVTINNNNSHNNPKSKNTATVSTDSPDNLEDKNVDEKLDQLIMVMKKHATNNTPLPHKNITPNTSLANTLGNTMTANPKESESTVYKTTSKAKTERAAETIDRYYPRNGFYSEFIFPPDQLQNFDLY